MAVRLAFATNGHGIYGIDMETGKEGELSLYPGPEEIRDLTFAAVNAWRDPFAAISAPDKSGTWTLRFYQELAVNRVLEHLAEGDTRILFLADRNTLANQAFNDFTSLAAFEEDALIRIKPEEIRKQGKVPTNASLFFTIFQTFMCGPPKRRNNVDTYAYFGEPVYTYSLKEGINDGFLTPFKVKQIATTLDEYVYTPDDKLIEGEVEPGLLPAGHGRRR